MVAATAHYLRAVVVAERSAIDEQFLESADRIPLLPVRCRDRLAVLAGVALVVATQALDQTFQQERPATSRS